MKEEDKLTPGRVTLVFFTRKEVVRDFSNKEADYGIKTIWG